MTKLQISPASVFDLHRTVDGAALGALEQSVSQAVYVQRGRAFRHLDLAGLTVALVDAYRQWAQAPLDDEAMYVTGDAEAEFQLRGLAVPMEMVADSVAVIAAAEVDRVSRMDPDELARAGEAVAARVAAARQHSN